MAMQKPDYLNRVRKFYSQHKRLPSYAEMADMFGFKSRNSIYRMVQKWLDMGVVQKINGKLSPASMFFALPLLGAVQAGVPQPAEQHDGESVVLDEYLVDNWDASFLLRVFGDSMIEAGIQEGDLAVVDQRREPRSGDVVAAFVDDEWTLKYFHKQNNKISLLPANSRYKPSYPRQSLQVAGVVVSTVRRYL
jgi:repressor LexA